MGESGRPEVFVHLLPRLIAPGALAGGTAIVVDVLRATTVMVHALASGCLAILPCAEIDEARAAASALPTGSALLAGERQGLPIEGFDLGNSPGDFTPEVCRGRTLVMTTTNGTRAILASVEAEAVGIGAFVNAEAAARWAAKLGRRVHVVCAGTDGHVSFEDALLAGLLADRLNRSAGYRVGNDEARIARDAYLQAEARASAEGGPGADAWARVLGEGRGGRRVAEIGLAADIAAAARRDGSGLVPVLGRDPLRIVPECGGGPTGIGASP